MRKEILYALIFSLVLFPLTITATPIERVFVKGGYFKYQAKAVAVGSFEISKYEITNESYATFLNARQVGADGMSKEKALINTGSADLQLEFKNKLWQVKKGYDNFPVVMVSYYGAVEFCIWAGGNLPTEAEWLYAASGGEKSKHYLFAGGNAFEKTGWFNVNSGHRLHRVGEKKANELGIYDMSGNAWEWCQHNTTLNDTSFCLHMGGSWYAGEQPGRLDARYGNTPTHCSNSIGFRVVFPPDILSNDKNFFTIYSGKPWNNQPQTIPGKIQCEWYDLGGEGIAYHDKDSINNGSGKLNPANGTFQNEFRMKEGADISYTKSRDIDNNPYNITEPVMDQFYLGWTVPGEWVNYRVNISISGEYTVAIMYTASGDGGMKLLVDGKKISNELLIPSTRNEKETIAWRQWHHWNKIDSLVTVKLKKGIHVLTLKTVTNGNMNYDYLDFKLNR